MAKCVVAIRMVIFNILLVFLSLPLCPYLVSTFLS